MRAIAVGAVIAYHAGVPGFGGGFVGVDVFFVISGFLITGQLLRDVETNGRVRYREFYARRVRRLLPAATLVILATLLGAAVLQSPLLRGETAFDALAATLFFANVRFADLATNYFHATAARSLFEHFWSLSVEEQFYLVWPSVVVLASGRIRTGRTRLGLVLACILAASFIASIRLTDSNQPLAYFSLATRAWELGVGAALAMAASKFGAMAPRVREFLTAAGVAAILYAVHFFSSDTAFPGAAAALPVGGAALMIAAGTAGEAAKLGRLLALWPFQLGGRYSYSLYLWHWPVLALAATQYNTIFRNWHRAAAALVLLALPLALASYHLVEMPFRTARSLKPPRTALFAGLGLIAISLGALVPFGLLTANERFSTDQAAPVLRANRGAGLVPTDFVPSNVTPTLEDSAADDGTGASSGCSYDDDCIVGDTASPNDIVLFGDSHAAHWTAAIDAAGKTLDRRVTRFAERGCGAFYLPQFNNFTEDCPGWREDSFRRIQQMRPDLVVLSNQSYTAFLRDPDGWREGVQRTFERMPSGLPVAVLAESPRARSDVPPCLADHLRSTRACEPDWPSNVVDRINDQLRTIALAHNATFVDITTWMCTAQRCPAIAGNVLVYRDSHHVTRQFSHARSRLMTDALQPLLG